MPEYRAYVIDGHFESSEVIVADDNERALAIADKLVDGNDIRNLAT